MSVLTLTQYLDTIKSIGVSENAKVIFVDSNMSKTADLVQSFQSALESSKN